MKFLDDWIEKVCRWIDDVFPGDRGLAIVGGALTGVEPGYALPVDRRLGFDTMFMSDYSRYMRRDNAGNWITGTGHSHPETDCGFWAYCHMLGYPCVRCGGRNRLNLPATAPTRADIQLHCPIGTSIGHHWLGCCDGPGATNYVMAFWDCCAPAAFGPTLPACGGAFCQGWPNAKNWCHNVGDYHCTVSANTGLTC